MFFIFTILVSSKPLLGGEGEGTFKDLARIKMSCVDGRYLSVALRTLCWMAEHSCWFLACPAKILTTLPWLETVEEKRQYYAFYKQIHGHWTKAGED